MAKELNDEQITELKEAFGRFEKNDGTISASDFGAVVMDLGYSSSKTELQEMMKAEGVHDQTYSALTLNGTFPRAITAYDRMHAIECYKGFKQWIIRRGLYLPSGYKEKGTIDFQTFLTMMTKKLSADEKELFHEAFRAFDSDGNGYISTKELRQVLKFLGELVSDTEADEIMKAADVDKSGKINCDQFVAFMSKR